MSAPINDNFANATALNGGSGSVLSTWWIGSGSLLNQTNISASSQVSESANYNGVWYLWIAPTPAISMSNVDIDTYAYYMNFNTIDTTRISGSYIVVTSSLVTGSVINTTGSFNYVTNSFNSVIQVFSQSGVPLVSASVSTSVEMQYFYQSFTQSYGHSGWGASVNVLTWPGQFYWIRVSGTTPNQQGNFILNWHTASLNAFGGTVNGNKTIQTDNTLRCLASLSPTMSFTGSSPTPGGTSFRFANSQSFGSYGPGRYTVKYTGGAGAFTNRTSNTIPNYDNAWCVENFDPIVGSLRYYVNYNSASVTTRVTCSNRPPPFSGRTNDTANGYYFTQKECQADWFVSCSQFPLVHSGGPIDLLYTISGSIWDINTNWGQPTFGNPDPIWTLYKISPSLSYKSACASWNGTAGTSSAVTFVIHNNNNVPWNVSASVSGIGITHADNKIYNMPANSDTSILCNFSCSNVGINAALVMTSNPTDWDSPVSFSAVYLAPVLVDVAFTNEGFAGTCAGHRFDNVSIVASNTGNWGINPQVISTIDHGLTFFDGSCVNTNPLTLGPMGNLGCAAYPAQGSLEFPVRAPAINTACGITSSFIEGSVTYSTYYFNTTITT